MCSGGGGSHDGPEQLAEAQDGEEDIHMYSYPQRDAGAWVGWGAPVQMQGPPGDVRGALTV